MARVVSSGVLLLALVACNNAADKDPIDDTPDAILEMSEVDLLIRASLDARGVRPTVAELERLEADPSQLDAMIGEFLQDPRFGGRVADLWSEIYLTRTEFYSVNVNAFDVNASQAEFIESIGAEPTKMLGHIADNDLPYTDIVLADWTMANPLLGEIWPIDYPDGASGWQKSTYSDGRPAAGVLSTNSMWWVRARARISAASTPPNDLPWPTSCMLTFSPSMPRMPV